MSTGHLVRPDGTINTGAKHTPGPWTVDKDWTTNKSGVKVFSIDQDEDAPHEQGFDCNQTTLAQVYDSEANARLIAAAPDMLNMLKRSPSLLEADDSFPNHAEEIQLLIEKATTNV